MNIFRFMGWLELLGKSLKNKWLIISLIGDLSHLISILILLHKMKTTSVCRITTPAVLSQCLTVSREERLGHLLQITSSLPHSLRDTISGCV